MGTVPNGWTAQRSRRKNATRTADALAKQQARQAQQVRWAQRQPLKLTWWRFRLSSPNRNSMPSCRTGVSSALEGCSWMAVQYIEAVRYYSLWDNCD